MDQMIIKTINKMEKHKHISGKDASLRFILPLLRQMHNQYAQAFQTIDGNFDTVFESLGIGEQGFIDDAVAFIQGYNSFVDQLMAAAGFFEADPDNEGAFRISPSMPPELQEELSTQQSRMVAFLQQLESLRLDEEDDEEDFEDEETSIDSESDASASSDEGDEPSGPPGDALPPSEVLTTEPSQGEIHA